MKLQIKTMNASTYHIVNNQNSVVTSIYLVFQYEKVCQCEYIIYKYLDISLLSSLSIYIVITNQCKWKHQNDYK